jgi:hypothetical protein
MYHEAPLRDFLAHEAELRGTKKPVWFAPNGFFLYPEALLRNYLAHEAELRGTK